MYTPCLLNFSGSLEFIQLYCWDNRNLAIGGGNDIGTTVFILRRDEVLGVRRLVRMNDNGIGSACSSGMNRGWVHRTIEL